MMKHIFFSLAISTILLQSCGGGGKTIGEVRKENAAFSTELNNKLIKAKEFINANPVDSTSTCDFKEKLVLINNANDFNAEYLLEDEINDWSSSTGEGLATTGRKFYLSSIKFTMSSLLDNSQPEHDQWEDTDNDLQKKVDQLKKIRYFVIFNKPSQMEVPDSLMKADFYILDTQSSEIVCEFALYTDSHRGATTYEEVAYRGNEKVGGSGTVENFQTKQGDDLKVMLKEYMVKNLKATVN